MHPAIATFPSVKFYDSKLKTGVPEEARVPPWPSPSPMAFVHAEGDERRIASSWSNEEEVKTVKRLVDGLVSSSRVAPDDVVVLTLYNAQVKMLKQALGAKFLVSSIDGFQGKEAPVVVVSTVRCKGELGECIANDSSPLFFFPYIFLII
jgi:superfamily I DNA and/or RNA helicase